jgi:hypothetical protein
MASSLQKGQSPSKKPDNWTSIRSPNDSKMPYAGQFPNMQDASGRRRFIWDLARFADPSLTNQKLTNIHGCATISAYKWAASMGWISITDGVLDALTDLSIWASRFPNIAVPWQGQIETGHLRVTGPSQAYQQWLDLNPGSVCAPWYWKSSDLGNTAEHLMVNTVALRGSRGFSAVDFPRYSICRIPRGKYHIELMNGRTQTWTSSVLTRIPR